MDIELLYFDGCSNWWNTLADVRAALTEAGRDDEVRPVKVDSQEAAERLRFLGSPTVRVNGVDVESGIPAEGYGMECRIYWVDGKPTGSPHGSGSQGRSRRVSARPPGCFAPVRAASAGRRALSRARGQASVGASEWVQGCALFRSPAPSVRTPLPPRPRGA